MMDLYGLLSGRKASSEEIPMINVEVINDNAASSSQAYDNYHAEASTSGYGIQDQTVSMVTANREKRRLNTSLLNAIEDNNNEELKSCLQNGASPNATCFLVQISACHAAAYANPDALEILLKSDADRNRMDAYGRTPLHMAAWTGKDLAVKMLLGLRPGTYKGKTLKPKTTNVTSKATIDAKCELDHDLAGKPKPKLADLPKSCMDSLEHKCESYLTLVPKFKRSWTPLHVASYAANHSTAELLLSNGADANSKDTMGQTPLDVAGAACYLQTQEIEMKNYVETIKILIKFGGEVNSELSLPSNCYSALHTAVELCSIEAIEELLAVGASFTHHNARGNTPLHECVIKKYEELLKIFVNHSTTDQSDPTVDVRNATGHTVLHMAIERSYIEGMCIALDARADVTVPANDKKTAVHLAALQGNVSILREILENVRRKSAISDEDEGLEAPLLCAMRSGNLDCVRMIVEAGASLIIKICDSAAHFDSLVKECYFSVYDLSNFLIHAATDFGNVNILKYLLEQDKQFEKLLVFKNMFFYGFTPVEYTIWSIKTRNKKETDFEMLKFLLGRTPGIENFEPPIAASVLDVPVSCHDNDIIIELLRVVPQALKKHCTRLLHQAILCLNEEMILRLIKIGADLSAVIDGVTAISRLMRYHPNATEFLAGIYDSCIYSNEWPVNHKRNMITIDYGVLVPTQSKPFERMKVLTALLNTGNRRKQKELLSHLLVETYIFWNWMSFSWYLHMLIIAYSLFVTSLSIYIVSVFYYKDTKEPVAPFWSPCFWQYPVLFILLITVLLDSAYTNVSITNLKSYLFWLKLLMKLGIYTLPMTIPPVITLESSEMEWRRHLASFILVLAWMNLMWLISSTLISGLLIQIFWKVTGKLIKILFTFSILIIMFSFVLMVQLHTQEPFDGPFAAIFKTMVMMTSEFEYEDNFGNSKSDIVTIQVLRFIFVLFLLLVAIVIMNIMTGVAIDDIQNLVKNGTLRRLEMQVHLMNDLESSMKYNKIFKILRLHKLFRAAKAPNKIEIQPSFGIADFIPSHTPSNIRQSTSDNLNNKIVAIQGHEVETFMEPILDMARKQFEKKSQKAVSIENESRLKEIHKVVTSKNERTLKTKSKWEKALSGLVAKRNKTNVKNTAGDTVNVSP